MTDDAGPGIYSPSDDTEGSALREFVDETIAREELARSLRSELFSPTTPPHESQTPSEHRGDSHTRRGPSQRYRRERESAYRSTGHREILRLLIEHEYEASKMRKTLDVVLSQLKDQTQRATEAESQAQAYSDRFQRLNENRLIAESEAQTLNDELTLYKIEYEVARKEISKAREAVRNLQARVDAAEQEARQARGSARKVKEALEVWKAREEGRKQGFEAGWNRAREEFGIVNAQPALEYDNDEEYPDIPPQMASFQPSETVGGDDETMSYRTYPPPNLLIQFPEVPEIPEIPEIPVVPGPIPPMNLPRAQPESILRRPPEPNPELFQPSNGPPRPPSTRLGMATPAIQEYSLAIPPAEEVEFDNRPPPPRQSSFRRQPQSQPAAPPPPSSWRTEPPIQRAPSPRPPDNFIPAVSEDGHIALPPPHMMSQHPSSPHPSVSALPGTANAYSSRAPSLDEGPRQEYTSSRSLDDGRRKEYTSSKGKARATDSWYNQQGEVDSRVNVPISESSQPPPQPEASASSSWYQNKPNSRRTSIASTKYSTANSSGGLLDAWGIPIQNEPRHRSGGLGNTIKNIFKGGKGKDRALSMIKEDPLSRQGSLNVAPTLASFRNAEGDRERERVHLDRNAEGDREREKVHLDPNLRYTDKPKYDRADVVGREYSRSSVMPPRDRLPRNVRVPSQLTVPAPLASQQQQPQPQRIPGHGRAMSAESSGSTFYYNAPPRTTSESTTRVATTEGENGRPNSRPSRRAQSMSGPEMSPPVSISIQPPSQSPSDVPAGLNSASRHGPGSPYLSPNNPSVSLPERGPVRQRSSSLNLGSPTAVSGNNPMAMSSRENWANTNPYHRQPGSPGFEDRRSKTPNSQRGHSRRASEALPNPYERSASAASNRHQQQQYPMYPSYSSSSQRLPPQTQSGNGRGHQRSESLGAGIGTPNSFRTDKSLPNAGYSGHMRSGSAASAASTVEGQGYGHGNGRGGVDAAEPSPLKRVASNLSAKSAGSQYSHFDPDTYRDPAFFEPDPEYQQRSRSRASNRQR